jgi:hypothetical protein
VRHLNKKIDNTLKMNFNKKTALGFSIAIFLYSCLNNHKTPSFSFKELNDSLTISNRRLKTQNDSLYKFLQIKLQNEKTAYDAGLWFAKAQYLQYQTAEIYKYIETSISNIKADSILNDADSLHTKLDFYKEKILRIDPDIDKAVNQNAGVITHYFDSIKQKESQKFNMYFSNKSRDEQLLILNQTLNNIESIENKILMFCNSKIN